VCEVASDAGDGETDRSAANAVGEGQRPGVTIDPRRAHAEQARGLAHVHRPIGGVGRGCDCSWSRRGRERGREPRPEVCLRRLQRPEGQRELVGRESVEVREEKVEGLQQRTRHRRGPRERRRPSPEVHARGPSRGVLGCRRDAIRGRAGAVLPRRRSSNKEKRRDRRRKRGKGREAAEWRPVAGAPREQGRGKRAKRGEGPGAARDASQAFHAFRADAFLPLMPPDRKRGYPHDHPMRISQKGARRGNFPCFPRFPR
jgi:hypothetical protein